MKIVVLKDMEGTEIEFDEDDCFQAKCDDGFSLHLAEIIVLKLNMMMDVHSPQVKTEELFYKID